MKKPFNETKFGKFISKAGKSIPDIVTIGAKALTGNFSGAIQEVGELLGMKAVNDEDARELFKEFELAKMDYQKEMYEIEIEAFKFEAAQVTDRWKSDMISDSWLSKNIRPMTLIFMLLTMTALIISDSVTSSFEVKNHWVKLLSDLLWIVFLAYFGGRTIEKFKKK